MQNSIRSAMVLAAGLGSRLRPLTDDTPKPLINVGGEPVILRSLMALKKAGINNIVINTHYLATMVEQTVRARTQGWGLQIAFSREDELLETGGGLKKALPLLGDAPFLVINSDAVWEEDIHPALRQLVNGFDRHKHDALLLTVPTKQTETFRPEGGDFKLDKKTGKLTFPPDKSKANVVFAGIHITHPPFIAYEAASRFSLVKPWREAAAAGRLHGLLYEHPWVDMGTHTGLHYARELISSQKA